MKYNIPDNDLIWESYNDTTVEATVEDYLKRLRKDPSFAERMRSQVKRNQEQGLTQFSDINKAAIMALKKFEKEQGNLSSIQETAGGIHWQTQMGSLYTGNDQLLNNWYEHYINEYKDLDLPQLEKLMKEVNQEVQNVQQTKQKSQEQTNRMSAGPVGSFYRPDLYTEEDINEIMDVFAKRQAVGWLWMSAANE